MNNDWKKYITIPNVFILLVVAYFVVLSERKMYVNTGPDPITIQFEKDLAEMRLNVQALNDADSIHYHKIIDYAKILIKNDVVVDSYSNEQLDSAFAALTTND